MRFLFGVLLVVVAPSLAAAQPAAPTNPFPPAAPESVGVDPAVLKELAAQVRSWIDDDDAVGAEVLLIKNRRTIFHEVFGWKDLDRREPLQPHTIACIRSMTKPLIGTAVQMLLDEGKLALSDPASKFLPSFDHPKSRGVTVEQLLTHTAGFPLTLMNRSHTAYKDQREVADQAGMIGPSLKPGAFSYSDADTETLAAIVAQISGQPVEEFLRRRILEPLGMADTYCVLGKDAPLRSRVSSNHAGSPTLWHKYWDHDAPPFFPYFLGAAGMYSTPADYARFLALWLDRGRLGSGRLLSEAAVERALRPSVPMLTLGGGGDAFPAMLPGFRTFYGQHWMVYARDQQPAPGMPAYFGHGGSDGTAALAFPAHDLMAFYFTQSRNGLSVLQFEEALAPLVGQPARAARKRRPVEELQALTGYYQGDNPNRGAYVMVRHNRLAVDLPGAGLLVPRWPDAEGRWAFSAANPKTAFQFERDAAGQVVALKLLEGDQALRLPRWPTARDLPTVDQLMAERHLKQGGNRLDALQKLRLTGTLTIGPTKTQGRLEVLADGPERVRRRAAFIGMTTMTLVDRGRVWQGVGQTCEEQTGMFAEQAAQTNPFLRLGDWRRPGRAVEVVRKAQRGGEDVWVVRVPGERLPPLTRYVSVKSGLLLAEDSWVTAKGVGTVPLAVRFEDYREVAGVLLPFRILSEGALTGQQIFEYKEATANPELPADAFAVPTQP